MKQSVCKIKDGLIPYESVANDGSSPVVWGRLEMAVLFLLGCVLIDASLLRSLSAYTDT
jgi:hypothetical protein